MDLKKEVYDVTIMGSGPAGLTAAIYTGRANLSPVMFEGPQPGGQLTITTDVENYPGFPDGIMGPEFIDRTRKQAQRFGTEIHQALIEKVDFDSHPYRVHLDNDSSFLTNTLIIASGAKARLLGAEGESHLMGYGVSTCATCDGFFFRDHEIAVVGGGDSALEEAIFLTKFASKVTLIHRRDEFRGSKIMQDRALKNEKIEVRWNAKVKEFVGERKTGVEKVILEDTQTGELSDLKVTGVFVAIGHIPNTQIFKGHLDMDDEGYIITQPDCSRTNIPGVFAVGDVQDHVYMQAVTAAGSGCMGALDAERWLEEESH